MADIALTSKPKARVRFAFLLNLTLLGLLLLMWALLSATTYSFMIAATTTKTGLTVACAEDTTDYRKGIKVTDDEMESLAIIRDELHPQWNYTISPRKSDRALILA
jgi:hypothetical protein